MEWSDDINWFAVHAKRFREAIAATGVRALGVEAFLPMLKVECLPETVIKVESKPLFPGYFFARFSPQVFLQTVECCSGVLHVIRSGLHPIPVEDSVIEEIRQRQGSDGRIRLGRRELKRGDRVSIQGGPFEGMVGLVESELDDNKRVALLLDALWQARVVMEKRWVQVQAA
jgi:transcriptional antiterminator RfaH